jgi:hypothetical protein
LDQDIAVTGLGNRHLVDYGAVGFGKKDGRGFSRHRGWLDLEVIRAARVFRAAQS